MRFENQTELPAQLFRGVLDHTRMFASCAVRVSYDWIGQGLVVAKEQPWIVSHGPWESPEGPFGSDELFYRGGVDLFLFGSAWAQHGVATPETMVTIRCGEFSHRLNVIGDRVWQRNGDALTPSAPTPFVSMPLSLDRSYGGSRPWDGIEITYPDNPHGRGFYLDENDALGQPLANIEHPDAPIRAWNDRPQPVGMGVPPGQFGPRLRKAVTFDEAGNMTEFKPAFFNQAFPDMILPSVKTGDRFVLSGLARDGLIAFAVPAPPIEVQLQLGAVKLTRVPNCDQIGVLPEKHQVFISYRYAFRYFVNPEEQRVCRVMPRTAAE